MVSRQTECEDACLIGDEKKRPPRRKKGMFTCVRPSSLGRPRGLCFLPSPFKCVLLSRCYIPSMLHVLGIRGYKSIQHFYEGHSEESLFPNICGLPLLLFFWLKWAGYLAVAGLNLLAQISDRISHFGV